VVDGEGRLTGVLTDGDLRRAFGRGFRDGPVAEAMTRAPRTAAPDTLAAETLALMNERKITSLFVVGAEGRPVGILHIHDLLRAGGDVTGPSLRPCRAPPRALRGRLPTSRTAFRDGAACRAYRWISRRCR
jgi:CBS-domain-containing membrane protein